MNFVSVRIITADVRRLVGFYETVLRAKARWFTDDFAELPTPSCTLAIAGTGTLALFGTDIAAAGQNRSAIVEFMVEHVDREFERLKPVVSAFVQEPTTMPWGNRSMLLRDPDGTLVNLFTPVSEQARARFGLA